MANWNILQPVDIGGAFNQAFQQGQALQRQRATDNALMKYAQNPNDPGSVSELAKYDPRLAIQVRGQMQQQRAKQQEAQSDQILMGAKIIRQVQPKDQAGWQQALGLARQFGVDISQVPEQYDPAYVQQIVAAADALSPARREDTPNSYDEYQRAQSDPNYAKFLEDRRGPLIANNGDGTFQIIPRQMFQQQPKQGGDPPPLPPGFVLDKDGGQTAQPSGGFPPQGN